MSVYETIKMSPLLGLQGSGGGLAYLAGLAGGDKVYVDDVFSTFLYTGNNSTNTINNGIDLAAEGGLVWIKNRPDTGGSDNLLFDTERGVAVELSSNQTRANRSTGTSNGLQSFNSNGFTIKGNWVGENASGDSCISWTFRKVPGFFDVVTWTGNGTAGRTIAHSLGSVPGMVIVKRTNGSDNWTVQHRSLGGTKSLYLNLTNSEDTSSTEWNNTAATSTVFTVGTSGKTNANGDTYVAYVFAHDDAQFGTGGDESIIKCGSYTGNGSTNGPTIDLGFEPQWVMVKAATGTGNWLMADNMRGVATGGDDPYLRADTAGDEYTTYSWIDFTATGFKLTNNGGSLNGSGTYIYMAIRRPHKPLDAFDPPLDATDVFLPIYHTSGQSRNVLQPTGFITDAVIHKRTPAGSNAALVFSRTSIGALATSSNGIQSTDAFHFDYQNGFAQDYVNITSSIIYAAKRSPGFLDEVHYTGNATARTQIHNLQAIPELVIYKGRNAYNRNWNIYTTAIDGTVDYLRLNSSDKVNHYSNGAVPVGFAAPTSSVFSLSTDDQLNAAGGKFVAYLLATLPGISKIGTYTGTGNAVNVNCGFTAGARFVTVKRTDASGEWFTWDSARGIVSGNSSYFNLRLNDAQVTNTDYIDPLGTGFTIAAGAPADLNTSGGTYLFLAIA